MKPATLTYTLLLSLGLLCGCGETASDAPELVEVTGSLTDKGQPVPGASVEFIPESGGAPSYAETDAEGKFTPVYSDGRTGAVAGQHMIVVTEKFEPASAGGDTQTPAAKPKEPRALRQKASVSENNNTFTLEFTQ